jgi:NAD(P)H-dependent FMN reductase
MPAPKILVIPGSLRSGSHNVRLAALATKELVLAEAEVTRISLADYPLPIYDADVAAESGPHAPAVSLALLAGHRGVFIASSEYNASITPLLKNTIDWIGRARAGEPQLAVFQHRAARRRLFPAAGGMQSLITCGRATTAAARWWSPVIGCPRRRRLRARPAPRRTRRRAAAGVRSRIDCANARVGATMITMSATADQ